MNTIKGLILKDLLNLSHYKTTLFIVVIFFSIFAITQENIFTYIPIILISMIGMICLSTFSYDEIAKSDKFLLTLPTDRKELVKSKYILVAIGTIIGAIFTFIFELIVANFVLKQEIDMFANILIILSAIFGITLIQCIQIPSVYKWGAERGRIQMFVMLVVVMGLLGGIVYLIMQNTTLNFDITILETILNNFAIPVLIILIFLLYYFSYKLSVKIYTKKEL